MYVHVPLTFPLHEGRHTEPTSRYDSLSSPTSFPPPNDGGGSQHVVQVAGGGRPPLFNLPQPPSPSLLLQTQPSTIKRVCSEIALAGRVTSLRTSLWEGSTTVVYTVVWRNSLVRVTN
jgi:hypothetical protein